MKIGTHYLLSDFPRDLFGGLMVTPVGNLLSTRYSTSTNRTIESPLPSATLSSHAQGSVGAEQLNMHFPVLGGDKYLSHQASLSFIESPSLCRLPQPSPRL